MNTKFHFVANYIYRQIRHVITLISRWHLTPGVLFDLRSYMMLYEFNYSMALTVSFVSHDSTSLMFKKNVWR